ncbi:MAG: 2-hydroxyglutaryl-CoA dehydratase [Firmicutes bacterium]|nr:2-hydroxyglutaryl-CoA dehydratase [Bacillota bacterium]
MITVGIDMGSVTTKAVVLVDGRWGGASLLPTGADNRGSAEAVLARALAEAGVGREQVAAIVATGYGRINAPFAHRQVTEITCHGRGCHALLPQTRTIVDVGGQDSKVIRVDDRGRVVDFVMNDKCAAGTGRFLEVMARALETDLAGLAALARRARASVPISSTCTVFAESEVISYVAQGRPKEEIIRGLHEAVVDRLEAMLGRVGVEPAVAMTGGVALNRAIVEELGRRLGMEVHVPPHPQLVGAFGAALIACAATT